MPVNGECIFGTRPWKIFGEGAPNVTGGGSFNEGRARAPTAEDIRFTTKGDAIYAVTMGVPDKTVVIKSMGKSSPLVTGDVTDVKLLGHDGRLEWSRDDGSLTIKVPDTKPCDYALAFKITGLKTVADADVSKLPWAPKPAPEEPARTTGQPGQTVAPAADGSVKLLPAQAQTQGRVRAEVRGDQPNLGFWDNPQDWAAWKVKFPQAGTYEVSVLIAAAKGGSEFVVEVAAQQITGKVPKTEGWDKYQTVSLGKVEIKAPGEMVVKVHSKDAATWKAINLAWVTLKPAK
jgi:alpha-L-fucosidase